METLPHHGLLQHLRTQSVAEPGCHNRPAVDACGRTLNFGANLADSGLAEAPLTTEAAETCSKNWALAGASRSAHAPKREYCSIALDMHRCQAKLAALSSARSR